VEYISRRSPLHKTAANGFLMKSPHATLFLLAVLLSGSGLAQQAPLTAPDQRSPSVNVAVRGGTPALQSILAAQQQIQTDPKRTEAYDELALAFLRRARETADPEYLKDADAALAQGLKLEQENFQLQRTQVAILLARHEFVHAKERATALHLRMRDDVMTFGYIARADIALGNYPDAEMNAQLMLNLRPNNIPGLLLGAELRRLYGDPRGAIEFLNLAYSETSPAESEDLAWIANQIASIQIESGQADAAEQTLKQAEQTFPHYPYTLENLARVRMAQNRPSEAVQLWIQASQLDGNPHLLYQLARAQEGAGQSKEAQANYSEFERLAGDPGKATDESKLDLILMYAASPTTAPKSLKLAQQEIAARQDVWTLDAYAWALYTNAKYQDADAAEQKALAVGIQDAQIFDHAGHIAQKLNHGADAAKYFRLSVQSNPSSEYAADAAKAGDLAVVPDKRGQTPSGGAPAEAEPHVAMANDSPLAAPDQADRTSVSVGARMTSGAPVFAPVPEALLTPRPTATSQLIRSAQAAVARSPADATAYAGLGAAYFQSARETGDVNDYELAEQSLTKSLNLVSADFSSDAALGTMASVCMGEHRFNDALSYGQKALSLGTGDISSFAIVGDAYADMGEYQKAHVAYGRLTPPDMTLSPRAAYARDSRLSYLRFIAGDTAAAIALMKIAVTEGVEAQLQSENLAWLYYELGEYYTQAGDASSADAAYLAALNIHPGDYRALAALGKLRANNGRYTEAVVLYQKAIAVVPMPIFIAELGDLYAKSGNQAEAKKQYALVEYIGLLGNINQVLHNRDLALFYADHDMKLVESLDLAQKELEVRHDVYTWDALAWALYKNGKLTEAAKASEKATQFGTRDSLLLFHAGMIADRLGQTEQARNELREALQINPRFHLIYANKAQQTLTVLDARADVKEGQENNAR
jgi:tetratricopeptide (TPR) repeat protein